MEKLNFCDEIVVVLDKCTDKTEKIVKKFTNKLYSGNWKFEGERRNFGINKCNSKWILELDADEHVSLQLGKEIIEKINQSNLIYSNFHIKINNYIGKNLVKNGWGGSFGSGGVTCLFKKGTKKWGRQRVHPELTFSGKFGPDLNNPIDHYFVDSISDLIKKFDSWTYLKSLDLLDSDKMYMLSFGDSRIQDYTIHKYDDRNTFIYPGTENNIIVLKPLTQRLYVCSFVMW